MNSPVDRLTRKGGSVDITKLPPPPTEKQPKQNKTKGLRYKKKVHRGLIAEKNSGNTPVVPTEKYDPHNPTIKTDRHGFVPGKGVNAFVVPEKEEPIGDQKLSKKVAFTATTILFLAIFFLL